MYCLGLQFERKEKAEQGAKIQQLEQKLEVRAFVVCMRPPEYVLYRLTAHCLGQFERNEKTMLEGRMATLEQQLEVRALLFVRTPKSVLYRLTLCGLGLQAERNAKTVLEGRMAALEQQLEVRALLFVCTPEVCAVRTDAGLPWVAVPVQCKDHTGREDGAAGAAVSGACFVVSTHRCGLRS